MEIGSSVTEPRVSAPSPAQARDSVIERKAKEFEALVLGEFIKPMFDGAQTSRLFGGGAGEEIFSSLLHERFAEAIAERGGVGIADRVSASLVALQTHQP